MNFKFSDTYRDQRETSFSKHDVATLTLFWVIVDQPRQTAKTVSMSAVITKLASAVNHLQVLTGGSAKVVERAKSLVLAPLDSGSAQLALAFLNSGPVSLASCGRILQTRNQRAAA